MLSLNSLIAGRSIDSTSSRLLRLLVIALVLVGVTDFFQKPLQAAPLHIGVVSILGDDFQLIRVGQTAWEQERHVDNVHSWNIDDFVTNVLSQQLGQTAELNVDVIQGAEVKYPGSKNPNFSLNRMFEAADTHGFDAVVIVRPAKDVKAAHLEGGYGLFHNNMGLPLLTVFPVPAPWVGPERRVFSVFLIELVDTRNLSVVGSILVQSSSKDLDVLYKPSLSEFSAAELEAMESHLKAMLKAEITMALRKLNPAELSAGQ